MRSSTTPGSDPVPFGDLSRAAADEGVAEAIDRVVASGWYVMGPEHDAFEAELAAYAGTSHGIAVGNGTDALELALAAVGVGPGDRVVTVANAGGYTTIASRLLGADPLYCDISAETHQATPETVEAAMEGAEGRIGAIVVTHLYGAMAPVEPIVVLAHARGIPVVEDCAQALGARTSGRAAGTFGDIATTSFYPTKNLGALGDGGALLTDSSEFAASVRAMRQYGWQGKYTIAHPHGRNSRMDELQAAVLRARLPRLDAANERRREIHLRYEQAAAGAGGVRMLNAASEAFIGHLAVVVADDRDAARDLLTDRGIRTDVHYPTPDHRQPLIAGEGVRPALPATEQAASAVFSLPLFPELRDDEIERVCAALGEL
jgi:dTDP-4-amino-4,6-dideoxygalactose transaminase